MTYRLFLDDERFPATYAEDWVIARTFDDAMWYLRVRGIPKHIAFDHDLGMQSRDGYQFAKAFCDYVFDNNLEIGEDFTFSVHSMNPVGARNISLYMTDFVTMMETIRNERKNS